MIVDLYMVFQFIKRLTTPFDQWPAYKFKIIDADGNQLRKRSDLNGIEQKESFTPFDIMVLKIKKLLAKVPGGNTKMGTFAAALWLIRDSISVNEEIEEIEEKILKYMQEDAVANCVGGGNIAGVGIGPKGEPPGKKNKLLKSVVRRKLASDMNDTINL